MPLCQIFNDYLEREGEASAVDQITRQLTQVASSVQTGRFSSQDWTGPNAPPAWKQALWMYHNPSSVRRLRAVCAGGGIDVALIHNLFPVGSAGIFRELFRRHIPLAHFIHNFRPFSVNGYLWANDQLAMAGLGKNYVPEIMAGSWQNS